jgi:hypothetical protein
MNKHEYDDHECDDPNCSAHQPDPPFNPETDSGIWWLSFANPICECCRLQGRPSFLGVAIVPGTGFKQAIEFSHTLGINPGGEVRGSMMPKEHLPPEHLRCRLLSEEELVEAGLIAD